MLYSCNEKKVHKCVSCYVPFKLSYIRHHRTRKVPEFIFFPRAENKLSSVRFHEKIFLNFNAKEDCNTGGGAYRKINY